MAKLEEQVKAAVGRLPWIALRKVLAGIEIRIDADDRSVTIYREVRDPMKIPFRDAERFVNDLY